MRAIVTGGRGFIGSNLVRTLLRCGYKVMTIDRESYASNPLSVNPESENHQVVKCDVADGNAMRKAINDLRPDVIYHLAAESHVDRSISDPSDFLKSNVMGTYELLQAMLYLEKKHSFRTTLVHVSTDEVYGSSSGEEFTENSPYRPNSPYAASKAASDHLVRAWCVTYGLNAVVTHASNNYGPFQHSEKLIPTVIRAAMSGEPIPVYGTGTQIRDWLHVSDHVCGLMSAAVLGVPGEAYNLCGNQQRTNLTIIGLICDYLDRTYRLGSGSYSDQITHVGDRLGHDNWYSVCADKAKVVLNWKPMMTLEHSLPSVIDWYVDKDENGPLSPEA